MRNYKKSLVLLCLVLLGIVLPVSNIAWAQESVEVEEGKFALGVGYAVVRFDTNANLPINKQVIPSLLIQKAPWVCPSGYFPVIYGAYRFSSKHSMGFSYFKVKRESTLLDFDETLGDVTITRSGES